MHLAKDPIWRDEDKKKWTSSQPFLSFKKMTERVSSCRKIDKEPYNANATNFAVVSPPK